MNESKSSIIFFLKNIGVDIMSPNKEKTNSKKLSIAAAAVLTIMLMVLSAMPNPSSKVPAELKTPGSAVQSAINLGTAGNFVILTKTGITTTGITTIVGDIGVSPIASTAMTGFGLILDSSGTFSTSSLVTGKIYAASYAAPTPSVMTTAISDMETAYTEAAGRTSPDHTELGTGNIGGMTLSPGLYKWSTPVTIPTDVILSGDSNAIWVFQIAQGLTVSSAAKVILSGGAQTKNIYWQVAGQTTLGTTSVMSGNVLCKTAIIFNSGAALNGRALAQTAVTLIANAIRAPTTATSTATSSATTTTTAAPNIAPLDLGLAVNFVVLSKTGVTTTGVTTIVGNMGVSPIAAAAMTGFGLVMDSSGKFATSSLVNGRIYAADYAVPTPSVLTTAISDMEAAFTDAAGRTNPDHTELGAGDISGMTLAPGLYKWSTVVSITSDITLAGNSNEVWIFQIATGLTVSSGVHIILSGGAQVKNIFWQVGTQATLGTYCVFNGNILAGTAIVFGTGATLEGRALAQTAITLDANAILMPLTKDVSTSIVTGSENTVTTDPLDPSSAVSSGIDGTPLIWVVGVGVLSVIFLIHIKKKNGMKSC